MGASRAAYYGDKGDIPGDATVGGDLAVSGNAAVTGTASVTGAATLHSTLAVTGDSTLSGNAVIAVAGKGLKVKEGSNATMGTGTLNGATEVTIATTKATATSRIMLSIQAPHGTPAGAIYVSSRSAGVSFGVKGVASDLSDFAWVIVEPAP